ncbi:MAG: hypothetical protein KOO63_08035 [Bacteroidales bacterium]|nr:hypothetical protein [Candidatus Latescibacterota bacterium]
MERLLTFGSKVGAALQEWDRLTGEEAAFQLMITKHDRMGEKDIVDTCLDGLRNIKTQKTTISELMNEAFGRTMAELRVLSYQLRVAAEQHEAVLLDRLRFDRTIEILEASNSFGGGEDEDITEELETTKETLRLQEEASLAHIVALVEKTD